MIYKDITVGIVAFKSEKVIFNCLKKLSKIKNIIVFDNSNDVLLKDLVKKNIQVLNIFYQKKILGLA